MRKLIVFVLIAAASNALCAQTDAAGAQQTIKVGPSVPDQPLPETLPALADDSYFRDPPFSDTLGPAPDLDEQRRIMHLVVDYVGNITHRLPNFFADRTTEHFEDEPKGHEAPAGAVTIRAGRVTVCHATLTDRTAHCSPAPGALGRGDHALVASYAGSTSFKSSSSPPRSLRVT